jgi:hypothetical protein
MSREAAQEFVTKLDRDSANETIHAPVAKRRHVKARHGSAGKAKLK